MQFSEPAFWLAVLCLAVGVFSGELLVVHCGVSRYVILFLFIFISALVTFNRRDNSDKFIVFFVIFILFDC